MSTGCQHYKCGKLVDRCKYHIIVQQLEEVVPALREQKRCYKRPRVWPLDEELQHLGSGFKINPLYSIFQEIEILSKKRYDPSQGGVIEWIDEVCNLK